MCADHSSIAGTPALLCPTYQYIISRKNVSEYHYYLFLRFAVQYSVYSTYPLCLRWNICTYVGTQNIACVLCYAHEKAAVRRGEESRNALLTNVNQPKSPSCLLPSFPR